MIRLFFAVLLYFIAKAIHTNLALGNSPLTCCQMRERILPNYSFKWRFVIQRSNSGWVKIGRDKDMAEGGGKEETWKGGGKRGRGQRVRLRPGERALVLQTAQCDIRNGETASKTLRL